MVARSSSVRSASLAGGQSLRLPGSSQQVALHDQLYRYAEDLQHVLERQSSLEENCNTLRSACVKLSESQRLHNEIVGQSPDLHFVTAADGRILQANPAAQTLAPMSQLIGSALKDWVLPACHPDFEALHAFELKDIPDDSVWQYFGPSMEQYRWDGGKLTPISQAKSR